MDLLASNKAAYSISDQTMSFDEERTLTIDSTQISEQEDKELAGATKERLNQRTVIIPENPFPDELIDAYPPLKFSWVIPKKLAAMALPRHKENLQFLVNQGVTRLVTLSAGKKPPMSESSLKWSEIPVEEFELPTVKQIAEFIALCKKADQNNEVVGVHCRQGRSRCGVMLACYLLHFHRLSVEQTARVVREMRPGSLECEEHMDRVQEYYKEIQQTNPVKFGVDEEYIQQLLEAARTD